MDTLDELFGRVSDGVCVSDAQGQVIYANAAARRMLDISGDERDVRLCDRLCRRLSDCGPGNCAERCPLLEPDSKEQGATFEGRYGPKTVYAWKEAGPSRLEQWKSLHVRCLRVPGSTADGEKSERHLTLIEDAAAQAAREQSSEEWREMIAHDLRSPLANIYGVLKSLEDIPAGKPLHPSEKGLLDVSLRACARMAELLDLFLELAQFDAGAVPVHLKNIPLLDLVKKCVEEQTVAAQVGGVEVKVSIAEDLRVLADAALLSRVVQNLLNNALKFTLQDGKVTISAAEEDGAVTLRVRDTGSGIAPEHIPFLFDRSYQAKARREGKIKGNGMGLTFCREALRAMGGSIAAKSEPGVGSEFIVSLPPAQTEAFVG
jgi:signal transduction histidine kinase